MRIGPRIGRAPDRPVLERDILRGSVCALLMVALFLKDLPLPLVLILPFVTYAGLRLIATAHAGTTSPPADERRRLADEDVDLTNYGPTFDLPTVQKVALDKRNGLAPDPLIRIDAPAPAPAESRLPASPPVAPNGHAVESRPSEPVIANGDHPVVSLNGRHDLPRQGEEKATATLTPRELDVLRILALGRSNKEIAEELFLSDKTVKTHVQNILHKLDLPSRSAAAAYAHKQGLV